MFSDLILEATTPGRWRLYQDLHWCGGPSESFVVPEGFVTDLASIPRLMRGLLKQNGVSRAPAVLHDYLYRTALVSRAQADAIFRRTLQEEGMCWPGGALYWIGVRLGGWAAFNKKRGT